MKKATKLMLAASLSFTMIAGGCTQPVSPTSESTAQETVTAETVAANSESSKFDLFTEKIFTENVSSDALSLHYALSDPAAYNIKLDSIDFGTVSSEEIADSSSEEAYLKELETFKYDELTKDQQLTYDILKNYLKVILSADSKELCLYPELLETSSGTHSLLPVLLAEYNFNNREDIEDYLALMNDFPRYFKEIINYEKEKSEAGLFMCDETADTVIEACQTFIATPEENVLIDVFPDKLKSVPDLTEDEINDFTKRNTQAVNDSVIPAYKDLIKGLESLKGTGTNEYGLYYYKYGKDYYEYLLRTQTGSSKTAQEWINLVETTLDQNLKTMSLLIMGTEGLYDKMDQIPEVDYNSPEEMLEALQQDIKDSFPAAATDQYTLKHVPTALEESMNPAFYMIPPYDTPYQNTIYLNDSQISENIDLFTTLAHEGYPGHLYQNNYFASLSPNILRNTLGFLGYTEGWATYVEKRSFEWAIDDEALCKVLQLNQSAMLCLYGRLDLGIHAEGWKENDAADFLSSYGINDNDVTHSIYRLIAENPCSYMPYCGGGIMFDQYYSKAKKELGDQFNEIDFHKFILDIGPCSFDILDTYFDQYLKDAKETE